MKKIATLIGLAPTLVVGQSLVHTTPENRTALLEEFTGIHCGYCPEGHAIAAALEAQLKDRFVTIGVHAGGYAVPNAGEPDFRTVDGTAIDAQFTVSGYPAATINRHLFDGADDLGRGLWEGAVNDILEMPSPVNVGVESSFNEATRELTVHVVGYYTAASASGDDYLSVALKEDHLIGYQADYTNGTHPNYDHIAVLRDHITDTWGENIGAPTAGQTVERTYTYTVDEDWNINNCKIVAFIGEYKREVYQAVEVVAVSGTTLVIGDLSGDPTPYRPGSTGANADFSNSFSNAMGSDQDFIVSVVDTYAPFGWATSFTVNGQDHSGPTTVSLANSGQLNITVHVTPNGNPGVSHYELRVASSSTPNAPVLAKPVHVISGVHDLIVTNPQAEEHMTLYWDGLWAEANKGWVSRVDYLGFVAGNALNGVNNLYMNISWTFPSYTDDVANALASFMDNGGNLMIAGQDIGWDQSGQTGSYGTPVTQAFYTNYLLADFQADGGSGNTSADFEGGDAVFGQLGDITITDPFGGALYPDHFAPLAPAVPILRYTPDSVAGLRAQTANYKLVYFGIGPEQVGDEDVAHAMVQLSHDWFYGAVGVEEFDAAMASLGQPYPSPASDVVNINLAGLADANRLEVIDASGRLVLSQGIATSATIATLDVSGLVNGLYSVRARGVNGAGKARTFEVLR